MLPIRQLATTELDAYLDHLLALTPSDKILRFEYNIQDDTIVSFVDRVRSDPQSHTIFAIYNDDLVIVGVGHISVIDKRMELAFSVLAEYQGRGYGGALMSRCLEWCRNRGITRGFMTCLAHNSAIRHLASKHGLSLKTRYGETLAEIELDAATPFTIANEAIASNYANLDYLSKVSQKMSKAVLLG